MIPILSGLAEIARRYDAYIVDLWGVVHDGIEPFPGVVDCLHRMRASGARVCLLSNAPRRVGSVVARLGEIGVPADCWDQVLSSGEATHLALLARADEFHRSLGRALFHLGPERDADVWHGLPDFTAVDDIARADWILNTGIDGAEETVDDHALLLEAAADRRLPMICANPDIVVAVGGRMQICAGALAAHYQTLGGRVAFHGKPYAPVYARCLDLLGRPDRARVLAIGDAFHTDMAGAAAAGIDGLFVTGGIHARDVGHPKPDPLRVADLAAKHQLQPVAALPRLAW
jgi:HAD superfamily hydrolase (TIGR01459 family)